jgi:predicted neuraminidase
MKTLVSVLCLAFSASAFAQILRSEFIYTDAPREAPSCHASTIAETKSSLVVAFFAGTGEGQRDVGVWISLQRNGAWSAPRQVATGEQPDGSRHPCWNPVLFQAPSNGPLLLFYKVGPSPSAWWGMLTTSNDDGQTWSAPRKLPKTILGPIKDKPILLASGALLCPSSTEDAGWRWHLEMTSDLGQTWSRSTPLNDGRTFSLIQPTLLDHGPDGLQALMRSKQGSIVESWSKDGGKLWTVPAATSLPNPNSGIDAVQLKDGRSLLIYNPTTKGRSPVSVAISSDGGKTWQESVELEKGPKEYSYPAVIQTADGLVHVTYTWRREKIRHVVIDPARLEATKDPHAGGN